jgi:hypothetical protein
VYASQTTPAQMDNGRKIANDNISSLGIRPEQLLHRRSAELYIPFFQSLQSEDQAHILHVEVLSKEKHYHDFAVAHAGEGSRHST